MIPISADTEGPKFENCPTETFVVEYLRPASFTPPTASDNSGALKSFEVNRPFKPGDLVTEDVTVVYTAMDYAGQVQSCDIVIERKGMLVK